MSTAQTPLSYLLLDGAQIDQLVAQIYTLEAEPSLYLLYQHSAYAALAEVGPVLVRVEPHTPLAAHFSECKALREYGWNPAPRQRILSITCVA